MRIIPAIDIIDGNCVRLTKGDYSTQKIYAENVVELAKSYEEAGFSYLHVVDLDGAKASHIVNENILREICSQTQLKVDFGGGIKSDKDIELAFESGANQITAGSIAVKEPEKVYAWLEKYGPEKIILGADCLKRKISTSGWKENSDWDVVDFIQHYEEKGIQYVICTDISKDGMLEGPSIDLYSEILAKTSVKLIASGGISTMNDLYKLKDIGCEGAIIGKAIYEGKISLKELQTLC